MNKPQNLFFLGILVVVTILAVIQTADAIRCHECNKEDCHKDIRDISQDECSSLLQIKTCMTVFSDESQSKIVHKSCGLPVFKDNGCKNVELKQFGLKLAYTCFCDSDLCNAASTIGRPVFLLLLLPLFGVVLGRH